jgi:1-acyl-sn-glycerol-3-phosphate acyltransferase
MTAGPAIDLSGYRGKEITGELLREVTDVIMSAVREQLGTIRAEAPPSEFFARPAAIDKPADPRG